MEVLMDISDSLFGIGNWIFAEYFIWVVVEGIIVPRSNGIEDRSLGTLTSGLNNSFYQGRSNI